MSKSIPLNDEQIWIEGCLKGDGNAQRAVFEKYKKRMYALCYRYCGNTTDAEDVLMQGFLKVFTKISSFKKEGSFEGWIKRIMIHEALQLLRKRNQLQTHELDDNTTQTLASPSISYMPDTEAYLHLIQSLPTGYRTVFNLYAIEGYSHSEIAQMLNISESTSKSQLSRARDILQTKLKQLEHLPEK